MKQTLFILVSVICVIVAFMAGRKTIPEVPINNADGLLAYQHYYECAERALENVTISDTVLAKEFAFAKQDLEDYYKGHIMTWPEVCDQRDKLSDIIRKYSNEENNNIMDYVREYFADPSILESWAYRY